MQPHKPVCILGLLFPLIKSCLRMAGSPLLLFKSPLLTPLRRPLSTPFKEDGPHSTENHCHSALFIFSTAKLKVCVRIFLSTRLFAVSSLQKASSTKTTALCICTGRKEGKEEGTFQGGLFRPLKSGLSEILPKIHLQRPRVIPPKSSSFRDPSRIREH